MAPLMSGVPASKRSGRPRIGGFLEGDALNHVAAALIGRHFFEQRGFAVEHADAGRPEKLVAGKGEEVAIERLHVNAQVRDGLRAVHQNDRADGVRAADEFAHGLDRAQRVGDVRDARGA